MIIHVVEPGDTLQMIAEYYGTSVSVLIRDNALSDPDNLVVGQCIIIAYPAVTYRVKPGDTLNDIANMHNVSLMQLLQNNPYLFDQDYLNVGDRIVISYDKIGRIASHGNALPYINQSTLRRTLPYLTSLSIVNYSSTDTGDVVSYYDDAEIIQITKDYNVLPLMSLTTLTLQGEANIRASYELLLSENLQDRLIDNILLILREKGFAGLNLSIEYISEAFFPYIEAAASRVAKRLKEEGFLSFVTINPNITFVGDELVFQRADFASLAYLTDSLFLMNYELPRNLNPPAPISSIYYMEAYINYLLGFVPQDKINIGLAVIGYDWELPFILGFSNAHAISYENAIALARNEGVDIQFDEVSQTPFFTYTTGGINPVDHIVWFTDARTINSLLGLVLNYGLRGTGIWNIAAFNTQLWLLITSQFEIEKIEVE